MTQKLHEEAMEYLKTAKLFERDIKYRQSIGNLDYNFLSSEEANFLEGIYYKLKDVSLRYGILKCLFHIKNFELKQFFMNAYKKERYLDMRLMAVRGLANFSSEMEIEQIMEHYLKILKKRPENTPYNYQEYEFIRSACGLPYLMKKYGYSCFERVFQQEEKQYNDMPDAFKGHFTYDEDGNCVELRDPEEVKKIMNSFYASM